MSTLLIALGVGIAAYILIMIAVPKAAPEEKDGNLKDALERLYEENRGQETGGLEVLRDQLKEESPLIRSLFGLPFMRPMYAAGVQAGFQGNLQQLFLIMVMAATGTLAVFLYMGMPMVGIIAAGAMAFLMPMRTCKRRIRKRNREFIDKFPDALDMIVRSVRSGFPLSTALQMLADNAEEPVKGEFRMVVDDLALGRNLTQALARLATRINEPDIRFFVVVLAVQQETGGNLSEIINNLSSVIRKRKQLRHKIRAMTSEGKATGWVLGALPVFVFCALYVLQPSYLQPFFYDPLGQMLFAGTLGLLVLCFFVVRSMINIDI